jgi:gamma-glutamyltranspeptidase/glutathione hydrolase
LRWYRSAIIPCIAFGMLLAVAAYLLGGCAAVKPQQEEQLPVVPPTPEVISENGMIVCAHPIAAQVGLDVMEGGGNAVDAAVAALWTLNVVEPHASGLGGGGFMGIRMAGEAPVYLNYREKAPMDVDSSQYYCPVDSLRVSMQAGASSVCVPGTPMGLSMVLKRYGTKDLEDVMSPALGLAKDGFAISEGLSAQITSHYEQIANDPSLSEVFLKDGVPLQPNDSLFQPSLGYTMERLREMGLGTFYRPEFCGRITAYLTLGGGVLTTKDFQGYDAQWVAPVLGSYRGYQIVTVPPPSAGGVALIEIMNILENFDLAGYEYGSPELIHLMAEAMKQGYADAAKWVADPDFCAIPLDTLLSKNYGAARAAEIPERETRVRVEPYDIAFADPGNTTHLVVVDARGNLVTVTQSINYFFGSGVMVPGLGIILNNEMADFDTVAGRRNSIEPGKRPKSNMTPTMVLKDGKPYIILGTPGGSRITSAMVQILVNVIDFGMSITEAIDAPRFHPVREHLVMENRFPAEVRNELEKMGHVLHLASPLHVYFGGAHAILIDPEDGALHGGADPRRDGKAIGY